jgi:CubicO group peptidase (beta-lactamase class C family)
MTETTPHILMSVSKSLLGLVAGVLATSGELEPDRKVTDLVPEVCETAYKGARSASSSTCASASRSMKNISRPPER